PAPTTRGLSTGSPRSLAEPRRRGRPALLRLVFLAADRRRDPLLLRERGRPLRAPGRAALRRDRVRAGRCVLHRIGRSRAGRREWGWLARPDPRVGVQLWGGPAPRDLSLLPRRTHGLGRGRAVHAAYRSWICAPAVGTRH